MCVRLFLARTFEQPSLMFAVWGCGQALGTDFSFPTGREHVPKFHSVMVTSISVKDALRHVVRDQLYVAGVVVRCSSEEFSEQLLVSATDCISRAWW